MGEAREPVEQEVRPASDAGRMREAQEQWARGVLGEGEWTRLSRVGRRWDLLTRLSAPVRVVGFACLVLSPIVVLGNVCFGEPPLDGVSLAAPVVAFGAIGAWLAMHQQVRAARTELARLSSDEARWAASVAFGEDLAYRLARRPVVWTVSQARRRREEEPPAAEEEARQLASLAGTLEGLAQETRDQIDPVEWARLSRLRDLCETCESVRAVSLWITAVVLFPLLIVGYSFAAYTYPGRVHLTLRPGLLLIPAVPVASWLAVGVLRHALLRRVMPLAQSGRDVASIIEALWAERGAAQVTRSERRRLAVVREEERPLSAWLRTELSGVHLLLWLAVVPLATYGRWQHQAPGWTVGPLVILGIAWVLKVCYWIPLLFARGRGPTLFCYRWLGTWQGTLVAIAIVPAFFVGFALVFLALMDLFGV